VWPLDGTSCVNTPAIAIHLCHSPYRPLAHLMKRGVIVRRSFRVLFFCSAGRPEHDTRPLEMVRHFLETFYENFSLVVSCRYLCENAFRQRYSR